MRPIRTTPTAIIQQIRSNLHDNYDPGFPILKELIQNADDAEAATLDIAFLKQATDGPEGAHPLLREAAMLVVNNGELTPQDAEKIVLMGEGNKAGQLPAIGKFGLGLKSIFHLCESFFYLANSDGTSALPRFEFVNLWMDTSLHPEWRQPVSEKDIQWMYSRIGSLIPNGHHWFCLWIPLRTKQQLGGKPPLTAEYPGDDHALTGQDPRDDGCATLFGEDYKVRVATLLPMMKHLKLVRSWRERLSEFDQAACVSIDTNAKRTRWHEHHGPFNGELCGNIRASGSSSAASPSSDLIEYYGRECWLESSDAESFRQSDAWPTQMWTDPETGEERSDKEKAIPHVAAYVVACPSSAQPSVHIVPAVFLPLGDATTLTSKCPGIEQFALVLHGYFFVDAGRRAISFAEGNDNATQTQSSEDGQGDERAVRLAWNRCLRDSGVLPLILPVLDYFAEQRGRASTSVDNLIEAITAAPKLHEKSVNTAASFFGSHADKICGRYHWTKRLSRSGPEWRLVCANELVSTLPTPPFEVSQLFDLFPSLADHAQKHAITAYDRCLSAMKPQALSLELLTELLDPERFDAGRAFSDPIRASYVVNVIVHCRHGRPPAADFYDRLIQTARSAILCNEQPPSDSLLAPLKRLVAEIPSHRRLVLRSRGRLPPEILILNLGILLVSSALAPEGEQKPTQISKDDAVTLLRELSRLRNPKDATNTLLTDFACQVLDACNAVGIRDLVVEECQHLPLFDALDVGQSRMRAFNAGELRSLMDRQCVFQRTERSETIARALQRAIEGNDFVLVTAQVGRALFNSLLDCDAVTCLNVLRARPALSEPSNRIDLLLGLFEQAVSAHPDSIPAVRYLLHGNPEAFDDHQQLFISPRGGPWAKLLKASLELQHEGWRVVAREVSSHLSPDRARVLGLSEVNATSVAAHLAAVPSHAGENGATLAKLELRDLDENERDMLFDEFPLDGAVGYATLASVLLALPLHRTLNGSRERVDEAGFLDDPVRGFELDEGLREQIVVFSCDTNPIRAAKQKQLFGDRQLTANSILRLAVSDDFRVHWKTVLSALNSDGDRSVVDDLRLRAWIPTRADAVAPIDVVLIPDVELRRLLPDVSIICESDLLAEFREHKHFAAGRRLFLKTDEALDYLGKLLRTHDRYLLGPEALQSVSLGAFLKAFEGDDVSMPSAVLLRRIVEEIGTERCAKHLVVHLLKPIESTIRTVTILEQLSMRCEQGQNDGELRTLFDIYLTDAACRTNFPVEILPNIRLANRKGEWRTPTELCVNWPSVAENYLLDLHQAEIIDRWVVQQSNDTPETVHVVEDETQGSLERLAHESATMLRQYFNRWSSAPPGAIAGFLALLGNHAEIVAFAEELVQPRRVQSIRDMLPWNVLEGNITGAGLGPSEAISRQRFVVTIGRPTTVSAINILNQRFDAPICDKPEQLVVGRPSAMRDRSQRLYYKLALRDIDVDQLNRSEVSDILRGSALLVLNWVYWQWHADLQEMWISLAAADQLDITVTQQILLDRAPANLPKLRTDRIPSLRKPLRELDESFHRLEEAKQAASALRAVRLTEAQRNLDRAKETLVRLLTEDAQIQAEVVEALRGKVVESGYSDTAVPFELLQNADDASVEFHEMHGTTESTRPASSRFRVCRDSSKLSFTHWGRPINKYRHAQFDGSDRGFRSDLSKMLALGESDKLANVEEKNTTGRFGLGFKSIFLICTRPRVLSAWLGFEVVAGIYPSRLNAQLVSQMREAIRAHGPPDGTLIELDGTAEESTDEVPKSLSRFLQLVHLVVICTRQIKRIEVQVQSREEVFEWRPQLLSGVIGAEIGQLRPWTKLDSSFRVLVLGGKRGKLILRVGYSGLEHFAEDVPTIWVTAPTMAHDKAGIILNGDFELDPGRTHLRPESQDNIAYCAELGRYVGQVLEQLFDESESAWPALREQLGINSSVSAEEFWASAYHLFTSRLVNVTGDSHGLLMEVLWADVDRGMHRLVCSRPSIPSGLPEPYNGLLRVGDIRFVIQAQPPGQSSWIDKVVTWASFRTHVRSRSTVSAEVWQHLRAMDVEAPPPTFIGIADVVGFELHGRFVDPDSAARLADIVSAREAESSSLNLRHNQPDRLGTLLLEAEFATRDKQSIPVPQLLVAHAKLDDEAKRAAFAPDYAVLSSEYTEKGIEFFRTCRLMHAGKLRIGVSEMAHWAASAITESAQIAVLNYLVSGELASGLGEDLKQRISQDANLWLASLDTSSLLQQAFPGNVNKQQLVLAQLGLVKEIISPPLPVFDFVEPPPPPDPARVLRTIAATWKKGDGRRVYDAQIYIGTKPPHCQLEGLLTSQAVRKEWMRLFMLGSMHTIGLAHRTEHGNFMQKCEKQGWLDIFSEPTVRAEMWLQVLDEYLDPAVRDVQYYRGMQRFISFYQFARHLQDYAYSFHDMNHGRQCVTLSQVLRSRENPLQSGGGVDLPPLTSALGIGACFVVRELVSCGLIRNPAAYRYCYVPVRRVRLLLAGMGCPGLLGSPPDRWELSSTIYSFLEKHLGDDATFGGDFDLPLLAAAEGKLTAYGLSEECEQFVEMGMQDLGE